jgi:hypothetical protein
MVLRAGSVSDRFDYIKITDQLRPARGVRAQIYSGSKAASTKTERESQELPDIIRCICTSQLNFPFVLKPATACKGNFL